MTRARSHSLRLLRTLLVLQLFLAAVVSNFAAAAPDSELKLAIILTRHGVRSPLQTNETLGKYAAEPWPTWNVTPGIQTPHGRQQMALMGGYYRERFVAEGLLSGDAAKDAPLLFLRSDNDQRTIDTTRAMGESLLPGGTVPEVVSLPPGRIDPLFRPVQVAPESADRALAAAAVLGRVGGDPATFLRAYQPEFTALQQVLTGPGGKLPAGKVALLDLPVQVRATPRGDHTINVDGPLHVVEQIVDAFILEYAEGLPRQDVGWGRVSPELLTQLLRLHSAYFLLGDGALYPSQAQGSNLAWHLSQTIAQAASGKPVAGAFGSPAQKLVVLGAHDTNIINLGGLLGLNWFVPGSQANPVLPGGALILELRRRRGDGQFIVRLQYVRQTLEQTRNLDHLSLQHPPAIAPIFVPGCSTATPGFDVPLEKFEALLHSVIDPKFVVPEEP